MSSIESAGETEGPGFQFKAPSTVLSLCDPWKEENLNQFQANVHH